MHGKVTDEAGKPVPSASVLIKGTSRGTTTDENGSFLLAASSGDVLVISSLGFANKEITLGNEDNLTISLISTNAQLEQIIVVGYGTQSR